MRPQGSITGVPEITEIKPPKPAASGGDKKINKADIVLSKEEKIVLTATDCDVNEYINEF